MALVKKIPLGNEALSLKNDGYLSLFFLGVGSAFSKLHFQTNLLIIKGDDHLLIDCGRVCPTAFYHYKNNLFNINNIFITHSHSDHIGGLEESALMGRYVLKRRPNMIITKEYQQVLWDYSLKGGIAFGETIDGQYLKFEDVFNPIRPELITDKPRPLYNIDIGSINLKFFRTHHIPDGTKSWEDSFLSYGVLIDEKVLFPADTNYDPELIFWLLKEFPTIQCVFHDCQLFNGAVHASYEQLLQLPDEIRKKMFLCHYGDNFKDFDPVKDGFISFTEEGTYYNFMD